jgi:hypothetical protein
MKKLLLLLAPIALAACGVKADPQAPLAPADIGHGKALYKNEDDSTPPPRKTLIDDEQKNDDPDEKE